MKSDVVIRARGLSKRYEIGELVSAGRLVRAVGRSLGLVNGSEPVEGKDFIWALKDVSFEVKRGEVLGIIGRNGSGKSTLLKILSRITKPTAGTAELHGKVGSLLEVGTGFHPELTGRANIYMNGSILGMSKRQIDARMDEIVEFSGVEKFLDTPVKRYSSGMYTRLAFAVAAHLDTDILICDEVLAVGDFAFQKRCLGRMSDLAQSGRTVLFVSHNLAAVSRLCVNCIVIHGGEKVTYDLTDKAVSTYLALGQVDHRGATLGLYRRADIQTGLLDSVLVNQQPLPGEVVVECNKPLEVELHGQTRTGVIRDFRAGIHVETDDNYRIVSFATPWSNLGHVDVEGRFQLKMRLDRLPLVPGRYFLSVGAGSRGEVLEWLEGVGQLNVKSPAAIEMGSELMPSYRDHGYLLTDARWEIESAP